MSDDERIKAIDRLDKDMQDKLAFQRNFNSRFSCDKRAACKAATGYQSTQTTIRTMTGYTLNIKL